MLTTYPAAMPRTAVAAAEPAKRPNPLGWLQRMICGLHGHDSMLALEGGRAFLRCTSCGHESPGWHLDGRRPPKITQAGDRKRHQIQRAV